MAQILIPGYLRWDGLKWILDEDVEIVGPAGPAGPMGTPGTNGTNGINGTNGTNGINGTNGATGPQGPQGIQGPQGPQGVAGATFNIVANGTTVDATPTTIATLALDDNTVTTIDCFVVGKITSTANAAKFNLSMSYVRQSAGAPVAVGSVTSYDQRSTATASTWTATITTSGNNAIVQVTGAAATTIDWSVQLQYLKVV